MSSAAGGEGETVRASHILIKHEGSRRKASWKDPDGRIISVTTRADAAARLLDLRQQNLSGEAAFADLAARHSDCSSARRGGDLVGFDDGGSSNCFILSVPLGGDRCRNPSKMPPLPSRLVS
ncbi:peptidyl-prolyl cis-trans isomerase Pin1-like isoform X2 [Phragmites australis]|uniref:peptidyl-prolyl cis-trans isomerase Pin1-like isoform X2 n=1 Tax=Phragmites australis TaxID=29695 RepID=UPI002D7A087C|nr:peptidyl-prolyl cis-trans isomerase Pin1-like isoform X2 [Phragmites australis]